MFPLVLAILVMTIYLGFYVTDRALLEAAVHETAAYFALREEEETAKEVNDKLHEVLQNRLLSVRECAAEVERRANRVTVRAVADFRIPLFAGLARQLFGWNMKISAEGKSVVTRPVPCVLLIRADSGREGEMFLWNGKIG